MRKLSALVFAASLFGSLATTWADPPAGRGNGNGGSRSNLQRAIDSRVGLQQRANARAQGSANAGAGIGIGQNSANANGNAGVNADVQIGGDGSANAQSGTGRLPREVVVRRLQLLRNQQSAVVRQASRTELGVGIGNDSSSDTSNRPADKKPQPNKPSRGKSGQAPNPNSPADDDADSGNRTGLLKLNGSARSEIVAHGQNRLALTNADKILAQRLAQIDQMRDKAVESGNEQLLDQADRLELQARTQYAERLAAGADDSATQTGADAQGQATGAVRGRVNRTTPRNPNPGTPADDSSDPSTTTDSGLLSGDAAATTQNQAAATLRNRAQRTQPGRRPVTPPAESGKIRNASLSGQANSSNAAEAAASNNSLDAAGTSATNAAANAQNK